MIVVLRSALQRTYELAPLLLCISGLAYGCHQSLKLWLAVSQAPVPERLVKVDAKVSKFRGALIGLAVIASEFGIYFGLGKLPQVALDGVWAAVTFLMCTFYISTALIPVVFEETTVFRTVHGAFAQKLSSPRISPWVVVAMTPFVVAGGMFLAWQGSHIPGATFAAVFTMVLTSRCMFPKISIRGAILLGMVFLVSGFILCGAIVGAISAYTYYFPSQSTSEASGFFSWDSQLNGEFIKEFAFPVYAWYICITGIYVSVALRFDYHMHSLLTASPLAITLASGKPTNEGKGSDLLGAVVPSALPAFKKPTYYAALAALSVSFVGPAIIMNLIGYTTPDILNLSAAIGALVSIPITSFVMILTACATGKFKAMWSYSESWVLPPTLTVSAVEQEASVEVKGEEQPLLVDAAGSA